MLTPKKKIKISQKDLKKDELIDVVEKASLWYYENQRNVLIAGVSIALVAVGLFLFSNWNKSKNEKASAELGKVYSLYDNQQFKEAIEGIPAQNIPGLKAIVDNNGGTDAGEIAQLYLANCYYNVGNIDEAYKSYDDCSVSAPQLKAAVESGLAACDESRKKYGDAGEHYRKAASFDPTNTISAEYLQSAAKNFGLAGQKETAVELLKRIKKEFPQSMQARDADKYLAEFSS